MSERIIKLLGTEVALAADTATTVSNAQLVRIHAHNEVLLTVKDGANTTGTCTLHNGETFYVKKKPTETIQVNGANCLAVSIAFGD